MSKGDDVTPAELSHHVSRLKAFGAQVRNGKVILFRGADVPVEVIRNLRYGDYLSAAKDGFDAVGNCGASSYGTNCVKFELAVEDVIVTGAGEYQYKGSSESLQNGQKYPAEIYKAYNDAYGANYTAKEIDAQDNVRAVACQSLSGGRDEFDELMVAHSGQDSPMLGERPRG